MHKHIEHMTRNCARHMSAMTKDVNAQQLYTESKAKTFLFSCLPFTGTVHDRMQARQRRHIKSMWYGAVKAVSVVANDDQKVKDAAKDLVKLHKQYHGSNTRFQDLYERSMLDAYGDFVAQARGALYAHARAQGLAPSINAFFCETQKVAEEELLQNPKMLPPIKKLASLVKS